MLASSVSRSQLLRDYFSTVTPEPSKNRLLTSKGLGCLNFDLKFYK
jgi:hypothetical protein